MNIGLTVTICGVQACEENVAAEMDYEDGGIIDVEGKGMESSPS